jgi:hypothetical protein
MSTSRRDDRKTASARPVHQVADQRRLIAEREAVDDPRLRRLAREQRATKRIRLDGDIDHMLTRAKRRQAMIDRDDRVAGAFDDDVDGGVRDQRFPVIGQMRVAFGERIVERSCGGLCRFPTDAIQIRARVGRR